MGELKSVPRKMTAADVAVILRDMAVRVEAGDSFEGSIDYTCMDESLDPKKDEFLVNGMYRLGNLEGQGGCRMISELK